MPSGILIHPAVWPQYTNVTDRTGQTDEQTDGHTDRQTGQRSDSIGEPFYKRSPKNGTHDPQNCITHFKIKQILAGEDGPLKLNLLTKQEITRSPAIAEGPRDAGVPVEIW